MSDPHTPESSAINVAVRHTIPAALDFLPLFPLRYNGVLYVAGQTGLFAADEAAWDYDYNGRWRGPTPLSTVVANVVIRGATQESDPASPADVVFRLPSGMDASAVFGLGGLSVHNNPVVRYLTINASTGAIVRNVPYVLDVVPGQSTRVPVGNPVGNTLADGSYIFAAHIETAVATFQLPPGYSRNDGLYSYGPAVEDYWDYDYNVGQLPPPGHNFYALRQLLVTANQTHDVPDYASYLISPDAQGGEWSAVKLVVGAGAFGVGAGYVPPCGESLYMVSDETTRVPVLFDPMTRSTNVLKRRSTGTLLIAGQRMTASGPVMALWEAVDTDGGLVETLLGTNLNPTNGTCECALANHGPTEIVETPEGVIYVLTKCSLHRYAPAALQVTDRLPGIPTATNGHPGGYSLKLWRGQLPFTTENFDTTSFTGPDGTARPQFYDILNLQVGEVRQIGPGTRYHGANDLEVWFNQLWGVMQDKPDSDPAATQHITWYDGYDWSFQSPITFPAALYRWQRVHGMPGSLANVLLAFGYKNGLESGTVGRGDGETFANGPFPWRIRRIAQSPAATDGPLTSLIVARPCTPAAIDTTQWQILETSGDSNKATFVDGSGGPVCTQLATLAALHINPDDLPDFLVWYDSLKIYRAATAAPTDGTPYLSKVVGDTTLCYVPHNGPPLTAECNGFVYDVLTHTARRVDVDTGTGAILHYCDDVIAPPPDGSSVVVMHYDVMAEPVNAVQCFDASGVLRDFNKLYQAIRLRVDSDAAADAWDTYTQVMPYSILKPLQAPAVSSIDVVFWGPDDMSVDDIIPVVFQRS